MNLTDTTIRTQTVSALTAAGIETTEQLALTLPAICYDLTGRKYMKDSKDQVAVIVGKVTGISGGMGAQDVSVTLEEYETGEKFRVYWFRQGYMYNQVSHTMGQIMAISGKVQYKWPYGYSIVCPEKFEPVSQFKPSILVKYKKIKGVSNEMLIKLHDQCIDTVEEPMDEALRNAAELPPIRATLRALNQPPSIKGYYRAKRDMRMRDMLYFADQMRNSYTHCEQGQILSNQDAMNTYIESLPYALTPDQKDAILKICDKTQTGQRIHMLVQGDVGCGKTTVAIAAALLTAGSGKQAVITAPTAVLATQHYNEIKGIADKLNSMGFNIKVGFAGGGMKASEKKQLAAGIGSGDINIVVGTHSTFADNYQYKDLSLVVVDEEHRFGVEQREALKAKGQEGVHIISMSATPIPRTLAGMIYGDDCEIAQIKTMPKGRTPVVSKQTVNESESFKFIESQLKEGRQCYVVCPRVISDDSEEDSKASVLDTLKRFAEHFEPLGYKCEAAHGKQRKNEMSAVLERFKSNETQILVASTVIEVGVNVPNASVILIENAEMFGLATLHQLRGRVGRGQHQSYCLFQSEDEDNARLQVLLSTTDGFKVAESDLNLRGMGNLIGLEQTGMNYYTSLMLQYPEEYKKAKDLLNQVYPIKERSIAHER